MFLTQLKRREFSHQFRITKKKQRVMWHSVIRYVAQCYQICGTVLLDMWHCYQICDSVIRYVAQCYQVCGTVLSDMDDLQTVGVSSLVQY
jgi:hypothetical protein